jgi:glycosyltransferase involved in cell wall biosynthesis
MTWILKCWQRVCEHAVRDDIQIHQSNLSLKERLKGASLTAVYWCLMMSTGIIVSYRPGDPELLGICLNAIARHTKADHEVIVAVDGSTKEFDAWQKKGVNVQYSFYEAEESLWGSARHGDMLNVITGRLMLANAHKRLLTLDSDCFPIADGWLTDLINMRADVAGILHPWEPPPESLDMATIEWRIRSGWNWNNTHVACQLTRAHYMMQYGLDYRKCDDTGLCVPQNAHDKGLSVKGFMPTMCPMPDDKFDPEFNREVCVVFGDKVFHMGGASRDKESLVWPAQSFNESRERVRKEGHARWILDEGYRYKFDREDEVVESKMQVMYALMKNHLKNNDRLFNG